MALTHNSTVADREPAWGDVDKTALPRQAFADQGDPDLKSTWRYPHHWVSGGTEKDENGVWTNGTLYLHRGGLNAAWSAAMGGRSGEEAPEAVIAHLRQHREALGLEGSSHAQQIRLTASASPSQAGGVPRVTITVYTGEPIEQPWSEHPVVLDISGIRARRQNGTPIVLHHDDRQILGHLTSVRVSDGALVAEGRLSGDPDLVRRVMEMYARGFPWAASIQAAISRWRRVDPGESVQANGREYTGPLLFVEAAEMGHVAIVPDPADVHTDVSVHASAHASQVRKGQTMDNPKAQPAQEHEPRAGLDVLELGLVLAKAQAEAEARFAEYEAPPKLSAQVRAEYCEALVQLRQQAVAENWLAEQVELEATRARLRAEKKLLEGERPPAVVPGGSKRDALEPQVIEAALVRRAGRDIGKLYPAEVCERADGLRDAGLQWLLLEAAAANGGDRQYRITRHNIAGVLRAAFPPVTAAWSGINVSGLLGAVANKLLVEPFSSVEDTWRRISAIRAVPDFKQMTAYRLTSSAVYEEVPPGGEIPHGTLAEESYTVQAKTYARMLALTMQDIVNDDLGAFDGIVSALARNAALKLNSVFWAEFLDNATFFTSARGNLKATNALSIDGLGAATQAFMEMAGDGGHPAGISPAYVLVPPAKLALAKQLYQSTEIRDTTASTKYPVANPFAGAYEPLASRYIGAALGGANGSDTTWYLLANPRDLPVMLVAFLDGQETPTVESADADFNVLGIQFRGYHSFGVAKAEYRAGVKNTA